MEDRSRGNESHIYVPGSLFNLYPIFFRDSPSLFDSKEIVNFEFTENVNASFSGGA